MNKQKIEKSIFGLDSKFSSRHLSLIISKKHENDALKKKKKTFCKFKKFYLKYQNSKVTNLTTDFYFLSIYKKKFNVLCWLFLFLHYFFFFLILSQKNIQAFSSILQNSLIIKKCLPSFIFKQTHNAMVENM